MRRPVRAEFSATASSSGFEHHCTPAGPSCTSTFGPPMADAMASVSSIYSLGDIGARTNSASIALRSSSASADRTGSPSPYTTGFWSRTAIAKAMRMPTSAAALADRPGFLHQRHLPARTGVVDHHRRAPGPRRARQRGSRRQIGIDRRAQRRSQDPAFQRHADRAERRRRRPRMIMRIDEGRNNERAPPGDRRGALRDFSDDRRYRAGARHFRRGRGQDHRTGCLPKLPWP